MSVLSTGGKLLATATAALTTYALARAPQVSRVAPSLRHPILYLPRHNKLSLYVQTHQWKKHFPLQAWGDSLRVEEVQVGATSAGKELVSYLNLPAHRSGDGAMIWFHGGGHLAGSAEADQLYCARLAHDLGVPVLNLEYRLGGEHPFPADIDDGLQALRWLGEQAKDFEINPLNIALAGASAGAGIAASVAQRARQENLPVAFQALIYPMLDDRTGFIENHQGRGAFIWSAASNLRAWNRYLNGRAGASDLAESAAPARASSLKGLPATWISCGTLDLFFPENRAYAERLQQAGVAVETHWVQGMYHGADGMLPLAEDSQKLWSSMLAALRRGLKLSAEPHQAGIFSSLKP